VSRAHRWLLIGVPATIVVGLVVVVALAFAGAFDPITDKVVHGGGTKVVRVALVDSTLGFDVTPDVVTIDPGTHLVLDVVNRSDDQHDLAVSGGAVRTPVLDPGASARLDLGTPVRDVDAWCTISEHKLFGMTIAIHVAPPVAAEAA
jgi:nitrite reductase (NO-forming)